MNAKITYVVIGIIAALGLIAAATLSAANSAFAGFAFGSKKECFKFYQSEYKLGLITLEQYKSEKENCRASF
ncbi:MAG TPA: hypothetical protein VE076_13480 [Nitrososphaeraceae archaeon]|jgi:hypothetical protein|nr:hypothetical protein [Nitrososphaeraceae archaeon]